MAKTTWVTIAKLAKDLKVNTQCISNWVKRDQIKSKYYPVFDRTLVNPKSLTIKNLEQNDKGIWEINLLEKNKKEV